MKRFLMCLVVFGLGFIGCDKPAQAATPPETIVILDDAPIVAESPAPIVLESSSPRVSVSVYESSPRVRTRTVTRTRVDRDRRSGGSTGNYGSAGGSARSRRERHVERSVSYGSAGGVSASVSYGSTGGR